MYKKLSRLLALAIVMVMTLTLSSGSVAAFEPGGGVELPALAGTPEEQWVQLNASLLSAEIPLSVDDAVIQLDETKAFATDYNGIKVIYLNNPSKQNGLEVSDLGTITFKRAAKIDNKDIDVIIDLNHLSVEAVADINPDTIPAQLQIAIFHEGTLWFCGYPLGTPGELTWGGRQLMDITTKIVYSDEPDKLINYPFIYGVTDLDFVSKEGVETVGGFSGKYYYFGDHTWIDNSDTNKLSFISNYYSPKDNGNHLGLDSYTKGGVYLQTKNGEFSTKLLTFHSGNAYRLFSQYKNNSPNPTKELVPPEKTTYSLGETVTFDVNFSMFNWIDIFETYAVLDIYDKIPDGLDFVSAKMTGADGGDIPGTPVEPSADNGNTFTYKIDKSWLDNKANYNGKDITLRIVTKVNGSKLGELVNTGFANVNGVELSTNEVKIEVLPSLSGLVWNDTNKDGVQDEVEEKVSGIKVSLYDKDGNKVGETTTGDDGAYKFDGLSAGKYTVKAGIDYTKYEITGKNKGTDDTKDSDADAAVADNQAVISDIEVPADKNVEHMDIGIVEISDVTTPGTTVTPKETTTTPDSTTTPEKTTTTPDGTTTPKKTTTTPDGTTTPEKTTTAPDGTTTPKKTTTTPEITTVPAATTEEATTTTAVPVVTETEPSATTKAESNPSTGNAPIAMISVFAALTAAGAMFTVSTKRRK